MMGSALHPSVTCYRSAPAGRPPETTLAQARTINWGNFTTIVSVCILVGTELVGMSWAAGWALGGLFGLAPAVARTVEIVFGLSGFVALYYFMRAAIKVEPLTH